MKRGKWVNEMDIEQSNRAFEVLLRISKYESCNLLRVACKGKYNLNYTEILEMAHNNIISEAKAVVRYLRKYHKKDEKK